LTLTTGTYCHSYPKRSSQRDKHHRAQPYVTLTPISYATSYDDRAVASNQEF